MPFELTFEFLGNYFESERAKSDIKFHVVSSPSAFIAIVTIRCVLSVMQSEASNPAFFIPAKSISP